ncbi:MAG: oligosaccharide flippase family protein [Bacteroidetes bacterium]|nr:oligosaccharide flippase family protein [Bacteroidota bacterium]
MGNKTYIYALFFMQQKKFVTNIAFLIILNLLIKPFWPLGIEPKVQDAVGNVAYGEYFILFNFSFLLNIILDFGVTNFNNKNIAQNNHLLTKHFSSLFSLKLLLGIVYLVVTLVLGFANGYDFRFMKLLFILSINQFLISMILYLRSNLLGLHLFKTDSLVSVLDRILMIAMCIALILHWFGLDIDVMNFVYAQTIGYIITAIIAFMTVYFKTTHFKLTWNWPFSIMILKQSFPFAILVLLMTFYNRLDAVMIGKLLPGVEGAEQAGIYAKAFRLLDAGNMIAYLFSVQLLPVFSRMLKYKESVEQLVKLSFILLVTPAMIVSVGCFFYSSELMQLINHGKSDAAVVFSILMCCFTAVSSTYIFGTLLTANGNLRQLNLTALTGICINVLLNIILIPHYKAMGSAYASLVTQFFTALVQIGFVYKIFKFKINVRLILAIIVFLAGIIIFNIFSRTFTGNWMMNFAIMVVFCGTWAFVSGLLNPKSILRFIKYK